MGLLHLHAITRDRPLVHLLVVNNLPIPPRHDNTEDISLITYLNEAAARHGQPVKAGRTVKAARQPLKAVELLTVLSKVTAGDGTGRMPIDEKNVGM